MKRTCRTVGLLVLAVAGCSGNGGEEPLADKGLEVLENWAGLPVLGDLGYYQYSSYDRMYGTDLQTDPGNKDCNNFIGICGDRPEVYEQEVDETGRCDPGVEGYVIASDDDGPGFVSRIWFTTAPLLPASGLEVADEVIRIYVDDFATPAYRDELADWVTGEGEFPFIEPFTGTTSGSLVSFFPISYQSRLRIVLDNLHTSKLYYYHVDVQRGAPTLAFDARAFEPSRLEEIGAKLQGGAREVFNSDALLDERVTLPAGRVVVALDHQGSGTIGLFEMVFEGARVEDLRQIVLEWQWDEQDGPAVRLPLAAFFGLYRTISAFDTLPMQVQVQGDSVRMASYLPMPFSSRAVLRLTNQAERDTRPQIRIAAAPQTPDGEWGTLHADFRLAAAPLPEDALYRVAEIEGRGKFVGTMMFMQGEKVAGPIFPSWFSFLEGDEEIVVDGDTVALGTGTEDYFSGGWYFFDGPYNHPFGALMQLHADAETQTGVVSVLRWHILTDAIRFDQSLVFDFEYGANHPEVVVEYASVAYYYLQ